MVELPPAPVCLLTFETSPKPLGNVSDSPLWTFILSRWTAIMAMMTPRQPLDAVTRTAAAAIFLASRFAADPANVLMVAAHAVGTDTDTIASMTGGILGALSGQSWLGPASHQVQDSKYLTEIVGSILAREHVQRPHIANSPRRRQQLITLLEEKKGRRNSSAA